MDGVRYRDRAEAGRVLAAELRRSIDAGHLASGPDTVVVGLPRGGVPVAAEVARELGATLDVIVVRKLGVPGRPEYAMGAIGEDGVEVHNPDVLAAVAVPAEALARVSAIERAELERRAARFRAGRPRVALTGRQVIVVDDGLATGATARAACRVARAHGATHVVLAVPVAPRGWRREVGDAADALVCPWEPAGFRAVGDWYDDFSQTTDEEVVACLDAAAG